MKKSVCTLIRLGIVVSALPILGGCAAAPLATLGTVADIAGTAYSTGTSVFKDGRLDTAVMADSRQIEDAVRSAAWDLRLQVLRDRRVRPNKPNWEFELEDDRGAKFDISVEQRTETMAVVRVDVGYFGSEPLCRLVTARVLAHLPQATTRPKAVSTDTPTEGGANE